MKKRFFATMIAMVTLVASMVVGFSAQAEETQSSKLKEHVAPPKLTAPSGDTDQHQETGLFSEYGGEAPSEKLYASLYLEKENPSVDDLFIEKMNIGETYIVHVPIYWLAGDDRDLKNVLVKVGFRSQNEQCAYLTLYVKSDDETLVEYEYEFEVANGDKESYWYTLKNVGPAKLYNNGHLNGAQVNHADLLRRNGILIGYDDQDGLLPSGEEYGCELVFKIRLVEVDIDKDCPPKS